MIQYDHVCILFGHREPNLEEFGAMYQKIETDDEGDITIKKVVEHIRAVEAGGGKNDWVNKKLNGLLSEDRSETHVDLEEFLVKLNYQALYVQIFCCKAIIGDIEEAGWCVKRTRENELISDQDLLHVFSKVDRNQDMRVNRMELRLACKYLCKQFNIDTQHQGELFRDILASDRNNDGVLDFQEFKSAIKEAQRKLQQSIQK